MSHPDGSWNATHPFAQVWFIDGSHIFLPAAAAEAFEAAMLAGAPYFRAVGRFGEPHVIPVESVCNVTIWEPASIARYDADAALYPDDDQSTREPWQG